MRRTHFKHEIVGFIPESLEDGILYVSERYNTAVHKCACGCGEEVVTPLGPADWSIQLRDGNATLHPSIGNWSFACQSHYFIRQGKVIWSGRMSRQQIERARALDQTAREHHIHQTNREKALHQSWLYRAWIALKRWWKS